MTAHHRKIKTIQFALGNPAINYECQISSYTFNPTQDDGEQHFTLCPDGEFVEDPEPNETLELTFFSDWRSDGISDFLATNEGAEADFTLDRHPGITGEHTQRSGRLKLKAPPEGGEARTTESQTVTFRVIGKSTYTRIA